MMEDFMRHKHSKFTGKSTPDEANTWLRECEKISRVIDCTNAHRLSFVLSTSGRWSSRHSGDDKGDAAEDGWDAKELWSADADFAWGERHPKAEGRRNPVDAYRTRPKQVKSGAAAPGCRTSGESSSTYRTRAITASSGRKDAGFKGKSVAHDGGELGSKRWGPPIAPTDPRVGILPLYIVYFGDAAVGEVENADIWQVRRHDQSRQSHASLHASDDVPRS